MSGVEWRGDDIKRKAENAVKLGMKMTGSDLLITSKDLVHKKTGELMRSIRMRRPRNIHGTIIMQWGSFDINYAFWQEFLPLEKGGKPYLRPSADKHYPQLKQNVAKAWRQL